MADYFNMLANTLDFRLKSSIALQHNRVRLLCLLQIPSKVHDLIFSLPNFTIDFFELSNYLHVLHPFLVRPSLQLDIFLPVLILECLQVFQFLDKAVHLALQIANLTV